MDAASRNAAEKRRTTRQPTEAELQGMAEFLEEEWNLPKDEARLEAQTLRATVFPSYISDGPGYAGPVLVMLGGEPNVVMSFTLHHQPDGTVEVRRADS